MSKQNSPRSSITSFRARLRPLMSRVREAAADRPKPACLIVLAIDGIPHRLARSQWRSAHSTKLRSVFPTTSATAWASALTGLSVDEHGIPGVCFRLDEDSAGMIDVYRYPNALCAPQPETIFTDAGRAGLTPLAVLGDLIGLAGGWRDLLLHGASPTGGRRFFAGEREQCPSRLCANVEAEVEAALAIAGPGSPALIWAFVDADLRVHRHGYDAFILDFLDAIDALAARWADSGHIVVAHSDHGLVRTRHNSDLADAVDRLTVEFDALMGGAGRTRWFYVRPANEAAMRAQLEQLLPQDVALVSRDTLFSFGSAAWRRSGALAIIARGERFLAAPGYLFEHGSTLPDEVMTPFAIWDGAPSRPPVAR